MNPEFKPWLSNFPFLLFKTAPVDNSRVRSEVKAAHLAGTFKTCSLSSLGPETRHAKSFRETFSNSL